MNLSKYVQRFCLLIVVVLSLVGFSSTVIQADEARQLVIRGSEATAGVVYKLWYVSDELYPISRDRMAELNESLMDLSVQDLDKRYIRAVQSTPSDDNGEVVVQNLKEGVYYIRDDSERDWKYTPFVINFPFDNKSTENVVIAKKWPDNGSILLTKWGFDDKNENNPRLLDKVDFQLYRVGDLRPLRFNQHGQLSTDTNDRDTLTTDQNGQIYVQNLPLGEYYFKETKAHLGYSLLNNNISVSVTGKSVVKVVVKNYRETPPPSNPRRPWLPKTGEVRLIIGGVGFILILVAVCFAHRSKKAESARISENDIL